MGSWFGDGGSDVQEMLAVALISFCAEAFFGLTSFGVAITWNLGWQIAYSCGVGDGTLTSLSVNLVAAAVGVSSVQTAMLWRDLDWAFCFASVLPLFVSTCIGQKLMIVADGPWLKSGVGVILLAMTMQQVCSVWHAPVKDLGCPKPPPFDVCRLAHLRSLVGWFALSGFLAGLVGIGAPGMILFISFHKDEIDYNAWRAYKGLSRLVVQSSRILPLVLAGRTDVSGGWLGGVVLVATGLLGLSLGNYFARSIKGIATLQWWLIGLLFSSSIIMIAAAFGRAVQQDLSIAVGGAMALAVASVLVWHLTCRRHAPVVCERLLDEGPPP